MKILYFGGGLGNQIFEYSFYLALKERFPNENIFGVYPDFKFREHIGDSHSSFRRGLRWLFPEYRYMCGLYPSVEKLPLLLPICWIRRDIRLLFQIVRRK